MPLAYLTFLTGIAISAVAIYYSVLGLAAIFAAAVIPIVIMGTTLEIAKLVTAWWLKSNWHRAPITIKSYLTIAVLVLMFITSMGIFGFLSKAHTDQSIVSGDASAKLSLYDEKIKIAKDNIDANRKALKQMDGAVDQVMGRSQDEKGADKAVALRRSQAKERARLLNEISAEQKVIAQLSEERAPIAAENRKIEAEVGPIKYIAKLIYGDNPDQNILEKAVTWVIILIVIVFDPLAVLLLLASQMSFTWARQEGRNYELVQENSKEQGSREEETTSQQSDDGEASSEEIQQPESREKEEIVDVTNTLDEAKTKLGKFLDKLGRVHFPFSSNTKSFDIPKVDLAPVPSIEKTSLDLKDENSEKEIEGIEAWNKMIEEAEKAVNEEKMLANVIWTDALQKWREHNQEADIYEIQRAFDAGEIKELPWDEEYKKYKIFPELIDQSKYVQNEEQRESNLWQEARKNAHIENKDSLSQSDYQEKVQQAVIRDLIKSINDGKISITDLEENEINNIEKYLKETNDRKDNTDQST